VREGSPPVSPEAGDAGANETFFRVVYITMFHNIYHFSKLIQFAKSLKGLREYGAPILGCKKSVNYEVSSC
jgi:hypothetical protein